MNKALAGNKQEIIYTKQLNLKDKFWKNLSFDKDTTYAVHIISKKYGKINEAIYFYQSGKKTCQVPEKLIESFPEFTENKTLLV